MSTKYRTKKGNVTSKARKQKGDKKGKYPIFDVKSALSAIRLRHHSKDVKPSTVLSRVSRSKFSKNREVKKALKKAREIDKK